MASQEPILSRPLTPESSLTNSLYRATNTIDDLTLALSNFSRVTSPDPPAILTCCCGFEECENLQAWHEHKSQLDSRLTLSAGEYLVLASTHSHDFLMPFTEVGQALLQRHEAYVRQHEVSGRNP